MFTNNLLVQLLIYSFPIFFLGIRINRVTISLLNYIIIISNLFSSCKIENTELIYSSEPEILFQTVTDYICNGGRNMFAPFQDDYINVEFALAQWA